MNKIEITYNRLKVDGSRVGIEINPPVSIAEIEKLERILNRKLPSDLISFYCIANGFETNDYLFRVIPLEEVIEHRSQLDENRLHFAEYMIYSDSWDIILDPNDVEKYRIVNANHNSEETLTLTNSIFDFIDKYLIAGGIFEDFGLYDWYEGVKEVNIT